MFHRLGPTFWELAVQALSSTERGYDLLAPKFEYTPFRTPDAVLDAVAPHIGERGSVRDALDVCCGTGAAMRMLRPLCRERLVGLDFSQGMLDVARSLFGVTAGHGPSMVGASPAAASEARVEFVRGNALELPFGQEFDLVVCFGALGHIRGRDEPRFVAEIARVLRPDGRFVFVTSEMPPLYSLRYWISRGFNAAMRVRNWMLRPPFIMYYLTFLLPDCLTLLQRHGFQTRVLVNVFPKPFHPLRLVVATRSD